ncbi:hypothetical protein BGAL_0065g00360 [Botrytis galanthina]|uniref:Uncharacterized protein n=1 Tax=Botrytis galanthina TaxID=278940 RepID=A0A4S8R4P5_9HELO|nr:hypothetical protein BGAL_0065g00360 [Botrytis galanthina]
MPSYYFRNSSWSENPSDTGSAPVPDRMAEDVIEVEERVRDRMETERPSRVIDLHFGLFKHVLTHSYSSSPEHKKRDSLFISAVKKNATTRVTEMLSNDVTTIDDKYDYGRTALHYAAELGFLDMVRVLLQHADPNIQDRFGCTPLFDAVTATYNGSDMTNLLLENGAKIDIHNRLDKTALYTALEADMSVAERLIREDKVTLLDSIRMCGRVHSLQESTVRIVSLLLDHGVDVNVTDENGWNALHFACEKGNLAIVELLKHHHFLSAQKTRDGRTALHIASQKGEEKIAEFLLAHFKADQKITTKRNWTPLHFAAKHGKIDVAKCLVKWHANLMALTISGYNSAEIACEKGHDELANFLLEFMEPDQIFSVPNADNHSTLRIASSRGCIKVIEKIIAQARNKNKLLETLSELDQGCTVAYNAIEYGYEQAALLLLRSGAKSDGIDASRRNALHWAAQHDLVEVINYLASKDQDDFKLKLAQSDKSGNSPLHYAAEAQQVSILLCFLKVQHGIEAQSKNIDTRGWTALHWAACYDRLDIVKKMVIDLAEVEEKDALGRRAAEVVQSDSPRFIEMVEWLTLPERHPTMKSSPISLRKPACLSGADNICKNTKAYVMAIFPEDVIVRTTFSIYNVLYEFGPKRIISASADVYRIEDALEFKWIHLPANNIEWMKDLTQAVYYDIAGTKIEPGKNGEAIRVNRKISKETLASSSSSASNRPSSTFHDMREENIKEWDAYYSPHPAPPPPPRMSRGRRETRDAAKEYSKVDTFVKDCLSQNAGSNSARYLQPFFKIPYFCFSTTKHQGELQEIMTASKSQATTFEIPKLWEKRMIECYRLAGGESVHVPITLDQFYYHSLKDVQARNIDQVLFRHQKRMACTTIEECNYLLCMVSQLWVYVIDDETIITSCGTQWDDGSNLQKAIADHFIEDKDTRPHISSALEMSVLIAALCARNSIDRELIVGQDKQNLLQIFASAISSAADNEVQLFGEFMKTLDADIHTDRNSIYDIRTEINLLKEVKDIQDELNIIKRVLTHQDQVLNDTFHFLYRRRPNRRSEYAISNHLSDVVNYYRDLCRIELVLAEVEKLIYDSNEVHKNKDANISEAKWARKESEDTAKQGKTILVFTIVTIVFLPITFLTSLFALDISSFPHDESGNLSYGPGWAFSRLLGITVAVSLPLIGLALFVNEATELLSGLRRTTNSKKPTLQGNSSSDSLENEISRHATTVAPDESEATRYSPREWSRKGLRAVRRVIGGKRGDEEAHINVSEA